MTLQRKRTPAEAEVRLYLQEVAVPERGVSGTNAGICCSQRLLQGDRSVVIFDVDYRLFFWVVDET